MRQFLPRDIQRRINMTISGTWPRYHVSETVRVSNLPILSNVQANLSAGYPSIAAGKAAFHQNTFGRSVRMFERSSYPRSSHPRGRKIGTE
jgi:hypothetical protein